MNREPFYISTYLKKAPFYKRPLLGLVILVCLISFVASAKDHYLDRYKPVAIFTLDQDPESSELSDKDGRLKASVHNGDVGGMPSIVSGARDFLGDAWDFSNVTSCFISHADEEIFTLGDIENTEGISVSFWFKSDWKNKYTNHRIIGKPGIDISMHRGIGTGSLHASFGDYQIDILGSSKFDIFDEKWHHVVFTAEFNSEENNIAAYVDGKEVKRKGSFANKSFNSKSPRHWIVLGARSSLTYPYNGQLDDVAFFNYALKPSQVGGIFSGPVYAGMDQEIFHPNYAQLDAIVPTKTRIKWSLKEGPGKVRFKNYRQAKTLVAFSKPGEYVLEFSSQNHQAQELKITVHPPSKPKVIAGDPIRVESGSVAKLSAQVSVPGWKDLSKMKYLWSKVEGPGRVRFSRATGIKTAVKVSEPGLYRFKLLANAAGLKSEDQVSVVFGDVSDRHYAELLNPSYLFDLSEPANRDSAGVIDRAQGTCAELTEKDYLPQVEIGARSFTGNAWDFSKANAALRIHNRFNIAEFGNLEKSSGWSFSFWMKGNDYVRNFGRIAGSHIFNIQPRHFSNTEAGVTINVAGESMGSSIDIENRNLFNGEWQHIALVVDYNSSQDNLKLYVNGDLQSSISKTFKGNFHDIRTDHSHFWGSRNGGVDTFKGQLDDIAAFNYPLSEMQISYLYNGPSDEQLSLLKMPKVLVEAGKDQVLSLSKKEVYLQASAEGANQYKWELLSGPGSVSFSSPNGLKTKVTFGSLEATNNPDYREYVFKFSAWKNIDEVSIKSDDEMSVVLYKNEAPKTRKLSAVPPPGVHPRILFSPEDLPAMRERFKTDPYAIRATELMVEKYQNILYTDHTTMGHVYKQLRDGDPDVKVKLQVGDGVSDVYNYASGSGGFYGHLCGAAFLALMNDEEKAYELAGVVSKCAEKHLEFYRPNYGSYLAHDASGALGLAYDFLHQYMSEEQRKPVRQLLAKMTKWRQSMGTGLMSPDNSTNWRTFHDHIIIAALAIEGEEGYDHGLYRENVKKLRDFFTQHGVYRSGYAHEGWGYYNFGMTSGALTALATARREENLYETTNLYKSILGHYRSIVPGQTWMFSHGDSMGGKLTEPYNLLWVGRYLWPNDPAVKYLVNTLADNMLNSKDQRRLHLMPLMFAVGPRGQKETLQSSSSKLKLPLTLFCPDKGYVNTRSDWSDEALLLSFRCRMDKYFLGHVHPDSNSFELFALGHEWFTDPGKYPIYNDFHQTVLIDGVGGGGSSKAWTWPSIAGRFVNFQDSELMTVGSGDAKPFYDYVIHKPAPGTHVPGLSFEPVKNHGLKWTDFVYGKKPYLEAWRKKPITHNYSVHDHNPLIQYNPVQKAFRSAALIRGKHPYVLIADDYQKDNKARNYQWLGNCREGMVEQVSANGKDLILKQVEDESARLLVRVIQADNLKAGPRFVKAMSGPKRQLASTRVIIESDQVVNPNFKVFLYPFKKGQVLPKTTFKNGRLNIEWPDQKDQIQFNKSKEGYYKFDLKRGR